MKLKGRPISKKRSYKRSSSGRLYLDKRYKQWQEDALWQLKAYKEHYSKPIQVNYVFRGKGMYRFDLDNAVVGINDILQDAGIIENDNLIVSINAQKYQGYAEWETLIEVLEISN